MKAEAIKLGKKGQLSIPKEAMERLGLEGGETLLLDVTEDGTIVLRPAGVYPLEIYSDERVREFLETARLTEEEQEALSPVFSNAPDERGSL
jgi:AbrB family looped-hinge helix DNA binding protein